MCTITRVFSFSFTVYMPGGQPGRVVRDYGWGTVA